MRKLTLAVFLLTVLALPAVGQDEAAPAAKNPRVSLETSKGTIVVELHADKAPLSVENFLGYVEAGFYEGTIFHRVMPGFMVQGGGYTGGLSKKTTRPAIQNEADNGLKNDRGTLAMARTNNPHSATAQFYINTVDNAALNHTSKDMRGWGYAVFGKVIEGMDVVDAISASPTKRNGPFTHLPVEAISITKATVVHAD